LKVIGGVESDSRKGGGVGGRGEVGNRQKKKKTEVKQSSVAKLPLIRKRKMASAKGVKKGETKGKSQKGGFRKIKIRGR